MASEHLRSLTLVKVEGSSTHIRLTTAEEAEGLPFDDGTVCGSTEVEVDTLTGEALLEFLDFLTLGMTQLTRLTIKDVTLADPLSMDLIIKSETLKYLNIEGIGKSRVMTANEEHPLKSLQLDCPALDELECKSVHPAEISFNTPNLNTMALRLFRPKDDLKKLDIHQPKLTSLLLEFMFTEGLDLKCPNLETLVVRASNESNGKKHPLNLSLPKLQSLVVDRVNPSEISFDLPCLEYLQCRGMRTTPQQDARVFLNPAATPALKQLDISSPGFTGAELPALEWARIEFINEYSDKDFCFELKAPELEYLDLHQCSFLTMDLQCPKLESLRMRSCQLMDGGYHKDKETGLPYKAEYTKPIELSFPNLETVTVEKTPYEKITIQCEDGPVVVEEDPAQWKKMKYQWHREYEGWGRKDIRDVEGKYNKVPESFR